MLESFAARPSKNTVPLLPLQTSEFKSWVKNQSKSTLTWIKSTGFKAKHGEVCLVPSRDGRVSKALFGCGDGTTIFSWSALPSRLPKGRYVLFGDVDAALAEQVALGWGLGTYEFTRYRASKKTFATLVWPEGCDRPKIERTLTSIGLGRDLINTPAEDMNPTALTQVVRDLAKELGGECEVISGKKLLAENYPTVHAVGRAAKFPPALADLRWGDPKHPKVTLVGKGVCFDSGGLDLKNPAGMKLMKKDMGGAATAIAVARMVMAAALPVRLRLLIPAVENAVAGDAMRPLDVITTRKGLTVEVGNTDAEGRLILCDALAEADSESPDLILDFATLTGAARVALGSELPALFSSHDDVADELIAAGLAVGDPLWRMPLHDAYRRHLDSRVADLSNIANTSYGGAITAALFLREFVSYRKNRWMHIDTMAWHLAGRPGRPAGGEVMAARACAELLQRRYGASS